MTRREDPWDPPPQQSIPAERALVQTNELFGEARRRIWLRVAVLLCAGSGLACTAFLQMFGDGSLWNLFLLSFNAVMVLVHARGFAVDRRALNERRLHRDVTSNIALVEADPTYAKTLPSISDPTL